ncbi:vacuolar protein sorting-associated protein 45, partial [Tulasnella sp. 332]
MQRSAQGLVAVLLSLEKPMNRYERMSGMVRRLGVEHFTQFNEALFDFRHTQMPPLLFVIVGLNDPVTPLLSPWTYQALVHEIPGIQKRSGRLEHRPRCPTRTI